MFSAISVHEALQIIKNYFKELTIKESTKGGKWATNKSKQEKYSVIYVYIQARTRLLKASRKRCVLKRSYCIYFRNVSTFSILQSNMRTATGPIKKLIKNATDNKTKQQLKLKFIPKA